MMPLFDMLLNSQNGKGFSRIQKQFDLDEEQAQKAVEAVMPAFSTGLKRNTSSPMDFGAFMQALSNGQHAKYADKTKTAFSKQGVREGTGILKHLFGSKKTSRAVAQQAAQASGVNEDIIKQMLPTIASMVMGGLYKQSTGQTQNPGETDHPNSSNLTGASNISGGGILGQILGELVKGGIGNQTQPRKKRTRGRKKDNPLGDILEQMMGGSRRDAPTRNDSPLGQDNPLGQIFEDMLSAKRGRYEPEEETRSEREQTSREPDEFEMDDGFDSDGGFEDIGPSTRYQRPKHQKRRRSAPQKRRQNKSPGGLEDLFGDMFETGRDVDEGYQRNVESIFDKFMKR